jgi:excisionase family DNA binding protein
MDQQPQHDNGGGGELCTLADVAQLLRVPPATLRYWRHLGTGPHSFRIGRHVRYYRGDVDAWLEKQRGQSTDVQGQGRPVTPEG